MGGRRRRGRRRARSSAARRAAALRQRRRWGFAVCAPAARRRAGIGATVLGDRARLAGRVGEPRPRVQLRAGPHEVAGERVERRRRARGRAPRNARRGPAACSAARPRSAATRTAGARSRRRARAAAARRSPAGSIEIRVTRPAGRTGTPPRAPCGRRGGGGAASSGARARGAARSASSSASRASAAGERAQLGGDPGRAGALRSGRRRGRARPPGPRSARPRPPRAPRAPASATRPAMARHSAACAIIAAGSPISSVMSLSVATNPFRGDTPARMLQTGVPARELPRSSAPGPGRHGCGL